MQPFDEEEREGGTSPTGSENEADETMEDVEGDEGNGEGENDNDNEQVPDEREDGDASRMVNGDGPSIKLSSPTPKASPSPGLNSWMPSTRREAVTASLYDIAPTIAAPHSTSVNTVTTTPDLRWVFTGGADGYIRKFNWIDTANGKSMLTVAQRHPFVDSVTKAGVLLSYWENEEPQPRSPTNLQSDDLALSPVYSLAVQSQGLWLLSGLESGGINLQSVRHDEGKRIACLQKHTSAVSVLTMADDEKSVLSGSWDKMMYDWDLNTGQARQSFSGNGGGQISAIEFRPESSVAVPESGSGSGSGSDTETVVGDRGTLTGNNEVPPATNGVLTNGTAQNGTSAKGEGGQSPTDSLFGGNDADSLFGDGDDGGGGGESSVTLNGDDAGGGGGGGESSVTLNGDSGDANMNLGGFDEDDEFSRAIANGIAGEPEQASAAKAEMKTETELPNGLPHAESVDVPSTRPADAPSAPSSASRTTFLSASIDGAIRVWDRRSPTAVAQVESPNAPPWCMNACWSVDGNAIYAGRRNGTVEEFSVHRGFRGPERTFRFPGGSGAVSALKPMPNGRHLICASFDILRLYDLKDQAAFKHSSVPFLIVPGHRGGVISSLHIDPACRYLISTSGNRGWEGSTTEVLLGYEINTE